MQEAKPTLVVILVVSVATIIVWPAASAAISISFTTTLEPNSNKFLASEGYYIVKTFVFATDDKDLCSSNNCTYSIENGQFRPNMVTHGFTFEGDLKVSILQKPTQTITSKFFPIRIDLDKTGSIENMKGNKLSRIYSLGGVAKLGANIYDPDLKYQTENASLLVGRVNGILNNPSFKVKAERCFFCS